MREKTRCEVDEPLSRATERMQISGSPSSARHSLEHKRRPPSAPLMRLRLMPRLPLPQTVSGGARADVSASLYGAAPGPALAGAGEGLRSKRRIPSILAAH